MSKFPNSDANDSLPITDNPEYQKARAVILGGIALVLLAKTYDPAKRGILTLSDIERRFEDAESFLCFFEGVFIETESE